MNCMFCHGRSGTTLSNEHLFSVPVCRAFGIDRSATTARVDGKVWAVKSVARLADTEVKLPCKTCNSGWMNDLEKDMENLVAPWVRGRRPRLGPGPFDALSRWALKTHIVLSALDGGAKAFGTEHQDVKMGVLPEATRARQVYEDDDDATPGVTIGVARVTRSKYLWGFGNPTVTPSGRRHANARSASVTCVNLGDLQLWAVVPAFPTASVRLPRNVQRARANLVFARLPYASSGEPDLEAVVVDNGPHDIDVLLAEAARLTAEAW